MAEQPDSLSPTKRALLALKELQAKVDALEQARTEPIAIIGLGCRLPGGVDSPDSFWSVLHQSQDAITDVPGDRWNPDDYDSPDPALPGCPRRGGFVPHLWDFDAPFFRMAPREALSLDPQQRLLLEVSWEALEHGAIAPDSLNASLTGVFVGICSIDYWQQLLNQAPEQIDAYLATGNTHSVAAGRLSYLLGLTGPSLAVDTACSSSLVSVHLACQSLRNGECNLALAGGVNRILSPEPGINFARARMLSPDGRCRSFDADANGFVRAEGCGMVVLKRLRDAERDGDRIHAVILGSAVNHDGRTSGLTVPNGPSQQALVRQALDNSRVQPEQVSYLEAHGTGTALGDPIEVNALGAVFGGDRASGKPLILGSVKPTIGHLEAASGIAGLLKVVLALKHQQIPPNLHYQTPNPHVPWAELPIQVPTTPVAWPQGSDRRIAGVSAFGFNGTNAHVVLADAPDEAVPIAVDQDLPGWNVLCLSARDETALRQLAERYQAYIQKHPELRLGDVCWTAAVGRSHFPQRLAIVAQSMAELSDRISAYLRGESDAFVYQGRAATSELTEWEAKPSLEACHQLAERYIVGYGLEWSKVHPSRGNRRIPLPTYPFQRQTYRIVPKRNA
ncbi:MULTISPECIES: polyketide synthase [unclassified Leptolyngbya]|uniref:type I polyketide synthase n=1 Tax=unclassified Leptolyngbya TaxID=2650499 RepID=UPI0016848091|nr:MULTISPECIES: polyketide synthase [unclassified Leptolyngbya]MBD1912900.1 polyketide synthase [Leptolyngbya sp. FACHB-8]MBD2154771.1 polyketide synthase [Leptolyngbya sp. FACHB-16]